MGSLFVNSAVVQLRDPPDFLRLAVTTSVVETIMNFDEITINAVHQQSGFGQLYIEKVLRLLGGIGAYFHQSPIERLDFCSSLMVKCELPVILTLKTIYFTHG